MGIIRNITGRSIGMLGGMLWEHAYGTERFEEYSKLYWYEKLGYNMLVTGMKVVGATPEKILELTKD